VGPISLNTDNPEVAGTNWGSFSIDKSVSSSVTFSSTPSTPYSQGMHQVYISVFDPTVK
jgi:hypothetical protein